ncbi:hypothetical protein [Deinococcus rufus]|uniref:Uncharacterized protein n=1 Tax=Deinococcus rufus TaxID=2136097 RepID=A0ABV7Z7V4_9DEIO
MAELTPEAQALRRQAQREIRQNAGVMFRHRGTFTRGPHEWPVRFSVRDPDKVNRTAAAAAEASAQQFEVAYRDIRLLQVHPDDQRPVKGAQIAWDGGTLELLAWSQESDFSGLKTGTCVLRR